MSDKIVKRYTLVAELELEIDPSEFDEDYPLPKGVEDQYKGAIEEDARIFLNSNYEDGLEASLNCNHGLGYGQIEVGSISIKEHE